MKNKITVMHFVSGFTSGGVEQMLYNYCRFMDKDKYEFIIVYQHEPVQDCLEKMESIPCRAIRITARNENFIKNITDAYKLMKKYKPDIVHAHMNLMNFCALLPAKFAGVKIRISHSHIAEKNKSVIYRVMAYICKKLNVWNATALMACGSEAGYYMYGKNKMEKNQVLIIKNAIDLEYYRRDYELRAAFRNELSIDEDTLLIGHVGRFSEQKNHVRLLQIFKSVKNKRAKSKLLLIGTGELVEKMKDYAKTLGIEESVIFYGTTKNMKDVYSAIDVFVMPSLFEGFPVVSVEVQAAMVPSVFSNTIEPACKLSNLVRFVSLEESNDRWADIILQETEEKKKPELEMLYKAYDIREKAQELDHYYISYLKQITKGKVMSNDKN